MFPRNHRAKMPSVSPTQDSDTVRIASVSVVTIVQISSVEHSTVFTVVSASYVPLNIPSLEDIWKTTDDCLGRWLLATGRINAKRSS
jgi:hypothetical protein